MSELANALLEAWCDRRVYEAIARLWEAMQWINGLTDGWGECFQRLAYLREVARKEGGGGVTEDEIRQIDTLIGLVRR